MKIMPCQYIMLKEAVSGYLKTGIPLIGYDGTALKPAGLSDDIGLYYFCPKISHLLGISIDRTIDLVFMGWTIISLILGITGLCLFLKKRLTKALAIAEIIFLTFGYYFFVGGIYIIFLFICIAIIPLMLYFCRQHKISLPFIIFLIFSGLSVGIANLFRSHSGTGVLIFLGVILLFYLKNAWRQKIMLFALVVFGFLIPTIYFNQIIDRRDIYLMSIYPENERPLRKHAFWHTAYIGFGFIENEFGIKYKDEIAIEKVRSISPRTAYLSQEYERILKDETLKLIRAKPIFVIQTIFAKLGVILFYLLMSANVGLILAFYYKKSWQIEIAFCSGMIFNTLFGIIAIPAFSYLLGFITLAILYGIFSIDEAFTHIKWRRIVT